MNRRDSRVHITVRQNDTLQEFENFKKKFLFANKQITKQNCSLSLKIEELNAHISSLYVENLRLRASEIALQSQLRREREKCSKIMADAEAATRSLLKHFGIIRQSYNVPLDRPSSPKDLDSPPPLCKGPPPRSPTAPRLAQQPSVPDISEDPEPRETSSEESGPHVKLAVQSDDLPFDSSSKMTRKSVSRLPIPSRVASPPPPATLPILNLSGDEPIVRKKRKLSRRPSGLMVVTSEVPARSISPALDLPTRKEPELSEEDNDSTFKDVKDLELKEAKPDHTISARKSREKEKKSSAKDEGFNDLMETKERKKSKGQDAGSVTKLKDVTNSPRRRRAPSVTESASDVDSVRTSSDLSELASCHSVHLSPLSSPPPVGEDRFYLPTPLPSSAASTPIAHSISLPPTVGAENEGGRERRARKSVNYAEPKLNTKMRKPDSIPPPGARPSLPSLSLTPAVTPAATPSPSASSSHGRTTHNNNMHEGGELNEYGESVEGGPAQTSGSACRGSSSNAALKRRRLPRLNFEGGAEDFDDDEDDGADADAEFSDFKTGWSNVGSRRKSTQGGVRDGSNNDSRRRQLGDNEVRRHSIAV